LRKVLGPSAPVFKDGVYDASRKDAITDFQKLWGGQPDATVDKHGHTLQHLDRLANPLVLKLITLRKVANGGYLIAYVTCDGGSLPPAGKGYTLSLSFRDDQTSAQQKDGKIGTERHNILHAIKSGKRLAG
jgi:hypothetical protein